MAFLSKQFPGGTWFKISKHLFYNFIFAIIPNLVMIVMVVMTMIVMMMVTMLAMMMVTMMMMMIMVMASLTGHIYLATLPIEAQLWPALANWYTLYIEATFAFRWILSFSDPRKQALNLFVKSDIITRVTGSLLSSQKLFPRFHFLQINSNLLSNQDLTNWSLEKKCQHKSPPSKGFDQTANVISSDTLPRSESQFSNFLTPDFLLICLH